MNIEENYRESAQQQLKGNNRTRRIKVKLCFLSELLCLLFKLKLIFKPAILPNSFIFNCVFRTNRFLVVLGLPHILTLTIFLTNVFSGALARKARSGPIQENLVIA